jgi:DNA primase
VPVDLNALRAAHPIDAVAEAAGVTLRPSGRRLVGRCPLHDDRRPSFTVYPETASYYCYGCGSGGDVFDLCGRLWDLDFRRVLARLGAGPPERVGARWTGDRSPRRAPSLGTVSSRRVGDTERSTVLPPADTDPVTRSVVDVAVAFYHGRLWQSPAALAYLARRGIPPATARACRVGYAPGSGLADHLCALRLELARAEQVGLLGGAREPLAGRLVIPDLRDGHAAWLTGRLVEDRGAGMPRYLNLRLPAPLLGAGLVHGDEAVVVEGAVDFLVLHGWGLPVVALLGSHPSRATRAALTRFRQLYLALDADSAGRDGADVLRDQFGARAVVVELPPGVKDPADLAHTPTGRAAFLTALRAADYYGPLSRTDQRPGERRVA